MINRSLIDQFLNTNQTLSGVYRLVIDDRFDRLIMSAKIQTISCLTAFVCMRVNGSIRCIFNFDYRRFFSSFLPLQQLIAYFLIALVTGYVILVNVYATKGIKGLTVVLLINLTSQTCVLETARSTANTMLNLENVYANDSSLGRNVKQVIWMTSYLPFNMHCKSID